MFNIGNVKINNRIICAPMAGISNKAYRRILKMMNPGLIYTEMISNMGIIYNSKNTINMLDIDDKARPISIQIFGGDKQSYIKAAKEIEYNYHPDIIDINMGCPVPKVAVKSQAGSALLKDPNKIYDIVKGIVDNINTPVTVKIRSGWNNSSLNYIEVAKAVEKAGASAIAIHPRTREQGYSGKANWNIIKEIKECVNIPVIGNGDINNIFDAKRMLDETLCDAVMIGRGCIGNPWLIKECVEYVENNNIIEKPTYEQRAKMIYFHYNLLKEFYGEKKALTDIKTHALAYLKYIPNSKKLKNEFATFKNEEDFKISMNNLYSHIRNICENKQE